MVTVYEVEGWDTHDTTVEDNYGGLIAGIHSYITGLLGTGIAFRCSGAGTGSLERLIVPAGTGYTTLCMGVRVRPIAVGTLHDIFGMETAIGGTLVIRIRLDTANRLAVYTGSTLLATGTTVLSASSVHYVEIKAFANGASGTIELKLDGGTEIASMTANIGSTAMTAWYVQGGASPNICDFDDVYFADDFIGYVPRVFTAVANGAGNSAQWTPSASTNQSNIDDAQGHDSDTTYNKDNTAGHIDSFTHPAVPAGVGTISAVKWSAIVRKDDAAARQIAPHFRQSGTNYAGTTVYIGETYARRGQMYNTQPAGGAWSVSAIDNAEIGIKLVA